MPTTVYAAREGKRFADDHELVVVDCPTCFIRYAIPESFQRAAKHWPGSRPNGWKVCCPMGHTWHYVGENLRDQARRERERAAALTAELDQAKADLRGQKARASRYRNDRDRERRRVAAGVCPCCNRSFKDLRRHMRGQHPDFADVQAAREEG